MTTSIPLTALQLQSLIRNEGELEISLAEVEVPEPAADEVLVRIEAAPINPSDLGLLFGAADMGAARLARSDFGRRPRWTPDYPMQARRNPDGGNHRGRAKTEHLNFTAHNSPIFTICQ